LLPAATSTLCVHYIFFFLLAGQQLPVKYTQHAGLQKAHCRTKKLKNKTATSWALRNNGGTSHQKCGIKKSTGHTPALPAMEKW